MEVYLNKEGIVRNVKDTAAPPSKLDNSSKNKKDIAMIKIKRHVNYLIVIQPKGIKNYFHTCHGRGCKIGEEALADLVSV